MKVNQFAQVLRTAAKGSNRLRVDHSRIFAAGKEVYIIQMSGTDAGESMFAKVQTVDNRNNTVTISAGLTFNCATTGVSRCQVVTVPNFLKVTLKDRATISAEPWNGHTGGVLLFRSKLPVC